MRDDDEGFGPAARGGPRGSTRTAPDQTPSRSRQRRPDDDFGPALRGRSRRRRGGGTARRVAQALIAAVVVLCLYAGTLTALALTGIERIDVDGLATSQRGVLNVLLVGSDSREGLTDEERRELRTGQGDGLRTDTIMLLSTGGDRTAMLSFPRDLYVRRCDGSQGRINVAYQLGGPSCLVETVTQLSGIEIDHYMEVDFRGFVQIVDAVGGVRMQIDEPIEDPRAGPFIAAGCQDLSGAQALAYVRTREGPTGDLGRVERQQRLLRGLAAEVAEPSTLLNPVRMVDLTRSTASALTADRRLGPVDLVRLARGARGMASGRAQTHVVPGDPQRIGGAAVLVPGGGAERLFADFRSGAVLGVEEELEPADVELAVRNGAGVNGLAAQAATELEGRGFTVTEVGNAEPRERTVVLHGPGQAAAARTVAQALGDGVELEERADVQVPTLVLGRDAAGEDAPADDAPADDAPADEAPAAPAPPTEDDPAGEEPAPADDERPEVGC